MSVTSSERTPMELKPARQSRPAVNYSLQPPSLLKDYSKTNRWHRSLSRPSQQGLVPLRREIGGGLDGGQTSLSLTPNALLTARYYAAPQKKAPPTAADAAAPLDAASPGYCRHYPFSQVIYSNVLSSQPMLSYLPKPGGLPSPAGASNSPRSPSFVHRRRVARERSRVAGPLDRAMSSDRSSEAVVRRAITQLREAMHLPPK